MDGCFKTNIYTHCFLCGQLWDVTWATPNIGCWSHQGCDNLKFSKILQYVGWPTNCWMSIKLEMGLQKAYTHTQEAYERCLGWDGLILSSLCLLLLFFFSLVHINQYGITITPLQTSVVALFSPYTSSCLFHYNSMDYEQNLMLYLLHKLQHTSFQVLNNITMGKFINTLPIYLNFMEKCECLVMTFMFYYLSTTGRIIFIFYLKYT